MTEPTDRLREIATKIVVKYIDRGANKEIVGYVAAWLATACAEERERCAAELDRQRLPCLAAKIRSGE
jgi:hypothetical protein